MPPRSADLRVAGGERRLGILIFAIAALLRLPALDRVPPPLNADEASRGYDAWCLWETGADRYGERWPLFLKSFGPGDYTAAISAYLMVPAIALFGPGTAAIRLPSAVLGVLTVVGVWLFVRRILGAPTGILAALLLAVCPWHIKMSRLGHEAGLVPFFVTWGLVGMAQAGLPA